MYHDLNFSMRAICPVKAGFATTFAFFLRLTANSYMAFPALFIFIIQFHQRILIFYHV